MPDRRRWAAAAAGIAIAAAAPAAPLHGYLKLSDQWDASPSDSVAAMLGEQYRSDTHGDLRLIWTPQVGPWSLVAHGDLTFDHGGGVALQHDLLQALPQLAPQDPNRVSALRLNHNLTDGRRTRARAYFDRLYLGYSGEHLIVRFGRQAITWGTGLIFHPLDLFDPFSPYATDTEYKTGVDLAYGQWLFDDGSDLQALVVPRREPAPTRCPSDAMWVQEGAEGLRRKESVGARGSLPRPHFVTPCREPSSGSLHADRSSVGLRYHRVDGALESAVTLAVDRRDTVVGVSLGGALGTFNWSATVVPTFVDGGGTATSLVTDLTRAATWRGRPVTLLLEYYHNGFGHGGSGYALDALSADLVERLRRGQVFATGRDYLAGALTIDWTPLLKLEPTLLLSLHDRSALLLPQARYSLGENTELVFVGQLPLGPHGSEFQGPRLVPGGPVFAATPPQVYLRLAHYF